MNNWLKEKVVDLPCNTYNGKYERFLYYTKNEEKKYTNKNPKQGTRFHDIDCLFKRLVDHCVDNGYTNNDNTPLINSGSKHEFMSFVYKTSKKNY